MNEIFDSRITDANLWRMAALAPLVAAHGLWVDARAARMRPRPIVPAYHAVCAKAKARTSKSDAIRCPRPPRD